MPIGTPIESDGEDTAYVPLPLEEDALTIKEPDQGCPSRVAPNLTLPVLTKLKVKVIMPPLDSVL